MLAAVLADMPAAEADNQGWSIVTGPSDVALARSMSCPDASYCVVMSGSPYDTTAPVYDRGSWADAPFSDPGEDIEIADTSCATESFCMAVGQTIGDSAQAVIEQWNGSDWTIVPNPDSSANDPLVGVSCTSTTFCIAVGFVQNPGTSLEAAIIERWDGSEWVAEPSQPNMRPEAISCSSAKSCVAVGGAANAVVSNGQSLILDDGTWSEAPLPEFASFADVTSISCISATFCMATGNDDGEEPASWIWDGSEWSFVPTPTNLPDGSSSSARGAFNHVSCTSAQLCVGTGVALGTSTEQGFLATWDGTDWSMTGISAPDGNINAQFGPITCTPGPDGNASCFTIGTEAQANQGLPPISIVGQIGSAAVSLQATTTSLSRSPLGEYTASVLPVPASGSVTFEADGNGLRGCPSVNVDGNGEATCTPAYGTTISGTVVAVYSGDSSSAGSYSSAPSMTAASSAIWKMDYQPVNLNWQQLTAASCPSATYCVILGAITEGSGPANDHSLIWSAGTWTSTSFSEPPGATSWYMKAVSCASPVFCLAVGQSTTDNPNGLGVNSDTRTALVEAWNGSTWSIVAPLPQASAPDSDAISVSCPTASACVVVGAARNESFADLFDGDTWTTMLDGQYDFGKVSCADAADCVIVGGSPSTWIFEDGQWSSEQAVQGADSIEFNAVSCSSPTFCIAVGGVGQQAEGLGWGLTLAEEWNGSSWSVLPSPNSPYEGPNDLGGGSLEGISCAASNACVAVGLGNADPQVPVLQTWDGADWSLTPGPAPIASTLGAEMTLWAVSCVPNGGNASCVAVGGYDSNSLQRMGSLVMEATTAVGALAPTSTLMTQSASTLTATVAPAQPSAGAMDAGPAAIGQGDLAGGPSENLPTGDVTFLSDGGPIAACPPSALNGNGEASCDAGSESGPFTAVYSGDQTFDGSSASSGFASTGPGSGTGLGSAPSGSGSGSGSSGGSGTGSGSAPSGSGSGSGSSGGSGSGVGVGSTSPGPASGGGSGGGDASAPPTEPATSTPAPTTEPPGTAPAPQSSQVVTSGTSPASTLGPVPGQTVPSEAPTAAKLRVRLRLLPIPTTVRRGSEVRFTLNLGGRAGAPKGRVTFWSTTKVLCSARISKSGTASCAIREAAPGAGVIVISFSGSADYSAFKRTVRITVR